jgi:hypothetical protein
MPRGGKRAGAGRKSLRLWTQLSIAAACEEAQYKEAKNRARERHLSRTKATQMEQEQINKKVKLFGGSLKLALKARAFVGSSAKIDKFGRSRSYPITRPKALREGESIRAKIITRIAKEFGVTPRMVDRCWKAERPTLARLRHDLL